MEEMKDFTCNPVIRCDELNPMQHTHITAKTLLRLITQQLACISTVLTNIPIPKDTPQDTQDLLNSLSNYFNHASQEVAYYGEVNHKKLAEITRKLSTSPSKLQKARLEKQHDRCMKDYFN